MATYHTHLPPLAASSIASAAIAPKIFVLIADHLLPVAQL